MTDLETIPTAPTLQLCLRGEPRRRALERFVARSYRDHYGADVRHFLPLLAGVTKGRRTTAVIGMNPDAGQRFLDFYLDRPAEALLAEQLDREPGATCEIGNLCSNSAGCGMLGVAAMSAYLAGRHIDWAIFTGTRPLRLTFRRMGIDLVELGLADPARLPDGGASWGTYYDTSPMVVAAYVPEVRHATEHRLGSHHELLTEARLAGRRAAAAAALHPAVGA